MSTLHVWQLIDDEVSLVIAESEEAALDFYLEFTVQDREEYLAENAPIISQWPEDKPLTIEDADADPPRSQTLTPLGWVGLYPERTFLASTLD